MVAAFQMHQHQAAADAAVLSTEKLNEPPENTVLDFE